MLNYRQVKEFRTDLNRMGRQRFLTAHTEPVLLTANPQQSSGVGYFTRQKTMPLSGAASYAAKLGFVVEEDFLVIPILKAEGRPFPERIGVGRTRGTDIVLLSSDVSKYHAYFAIESERWTLTDASSSNGTFVNGERLAPMAPSRLEDGALVAFGSHLYQFRTPSGFCSLLVTI